MKILLKNRIIRNPRTQMNLFRLFLPSWVSAVVSFYLPGHVYFHIFREPKRIVRSSTMCQCRGVEFGSDGEAISRTLTKDQRDMSGVYKMLKFKYVNANAQCVFHSCQLDVNRTSYRRFSEEARNLLEYHKQFDSPKKKNHSNMSMRMHSAFFTRVNWMYELSIDEFPNRHESIPSIISNSAVQ